MIGAASGRSFAVLIRDNEWLTLTALLASHFAVVVACLVFSAFPVVEDAAQLVYADAQSDYLIGLVFGVVLGLAILAWPIARQERLALFAIWQAKLLVCMIAMPIYESYFVEIDAFHYFLAATRELGVIDMLEIGDGTENVVRLTAIAQLVLPDSYHATRILFACLGLVAVYFLYVAAKAAMKRDDLRVLFAIALFPSVLFWSSILGKDPLVLLGVGFVALGAASLTKGRTFAAACLLAIGLTIIAYMRIWLCLILVAPIGYVAMAHFGTLPRRFIAAVIIAVAAVSFYEAMSDRFDIASREDAVERYDAFSRGWSHLGGSSQLLDVDLTNPLEFLGFIPLAAFTALFRPLPLEIDSGFGLLSGLENALLLAAFAFALARARWRDLREPLVIAGVVYVAVWLVIYGPISYQNLGTAVRFKLQILPLFLLLCMYFGARKRER
ncbi:hypothetical protein [Usitatibacter palustris]|uniref:Glycosyltransferase RgtA/B/C/D-like domain-containing protein n=1 Tax=Usitatibacter palustris TaxID=2732487 RepID=A0A6M4H7Q5_9PROT|nr:hypothetical protein [Usitatibacter palustris]QJR15679.1 hypothetical protein DSM104440_02504 [Usitatibacter palustris]